MSEILTPEQVAELRRDINEMDPMPKRETALVLTLCDTVEAQAEVIERYKDGWGCSTPDERRDGWRPEWWRQEETGGPAFSLRTEPMPEAHQLIIYGEVMRSEP